MANLKPRQSLFGIPIQIFSGKPVHSFFAKTIQRARDAREAERARLENMQRNTFFSVLGAAQRRADATRAETFNAELKSRTGCT